MKQLTASDCLRRRVRRVLGEEQPQPNADGIVFAVFSGATRSGTFCGLVTERDIALHPDWTFADLVDNRPLEKVAPDTALCAVLRQMAQTGRDALPILGKDDRFIGVLTQNSLLQGLLRQERGLLSEAGLYRRQADEEIRRQALWASGLAKMHVASRSLLTLFAHSSNERDMLQHGINALTDLLQARYGAIGVISAEGELAHFVHTGIDAETQARIGELPKGRGLLGVVINEDTVIRLDDMAGDPRSVGFPPHHPPMKSLLAVPISNMGRIYGRIYLSDKMSGEPFDFDDELLAQSLAHSLSLMLDNAREFRELQAAQQRLDYLAYHDALTGLPNRRLAVDRIQQAMTLAQRHGGVVALLFVDLDKFKVVNDSFGHAVGDQLLCAVAQRFNNCTREGDTVWRQGGDEFVIMLPDLREADEAALVAQKILEIMASPCQLADCEQVISVSIGISMFPRDAATVDELLQGADTAMYHAKQGGRNNYQFFTREA